MGAETRSEIPMTCVMHESRIESLEDRAKTIESELKGHGLMLVRIETKLDSWLPEAKKRAEQDEARARELVPRYVWPIVIVLLSAAITATISHLMQAAK